MKRLYKFKLGGYPMNYDAHCHIDKLSEKELSNAIISKFIICGVSLNLSSSKEVLKLKKLYPENIYAFLGTHPEVFDSYDDTEEVIELIKANCHIVSGVGEIGIPYFYLEDKGNEEIKKIKNKALIILEKYLSIAKEYSLLVNLHVVGDDIELVLPILSKYSIETPLFHWYNGSLENLKKIIDYRGFISVSPDILYNKSYLEFIKEVPLDMLLLESDGPWEYNFERGIPNMILRVGEVLSSIHNLDLEVFLFKIAENSKRYLK